MRIQTPYRIGVFIFCLLPAAWLLYRALTNDLGANPVEALTHASGDWALRFLLITLALSPLRGILGWTWLMGLRRMLGLYAFFYACLHFAAYLVLDQFFDWSAILADIAKRPYITVGFAAFILLVPLAVTSTKSMMRRLGKHWQRLHRLVYFIGILGVVHYLWLVKADLREPLIYTGILAFLLGWRVWKRVLKNTSSATKSTRS